MYSVAERIKYLRKNKDLTQNELGRKVGVTGVTISKWELDIAKPKSNSAILLCKVFGVDLQWLMLGDVKGVTFGASQLDNDNNEVIKVPFFSDMDSIIGVDGSFKPENASYHLSMPKQLFNREVGNILCMAVPGDSMEPRFKSGNILAIDLDNKKIIDGNCYLVNHNGLLRFKCLERIPTGYILKSYNSMYKDTIINRSDIFSIIGQLFFKLSFYD
ncbi:XRE family transcriptional regulator (plasmid) [Shewanella baltica]|uniref:XRE family transcriptional regulator n=1 Tax=Shewanella baltica TaxID=62322 RepID=UPI0030CA6D70